MIPPVYRKSERFPTQWSYTLAWLRERGDKGVHTFELRRAMIGNPSQRQAELEDRGHVVSADRERLNGDAVGARYRLVYDAETGARLNLSELGGKDAASVVGLPPRVDDTAADRTAPAAPVSGALFSADEFAPRHAYYEQEVA